MADDVVSRLTVTTEGCQLADTDTGVLGEDTGVHSLDDPLSWSFSERLQ